ncbi:MAG TPA: hypothetical protein VH023_18935, partial [Rhodopila sp.]|nr:hypothetical protein [Rhodopila sp.]
AGAPVLFVCHLMGLVFFGLLIGGAELVQVYRHRRFRVAVERGLVLAAVFAVPVVLYAVSDLRHLGGDAAFLPIGQKLLQLVTVFANYDGRLDLATAGFAFGLPLLCLLSRRGSVPGPAGCTIALLLIGFLAMPYGWKGTFRLDTRFAVMLGFMLFAGFVPARWPLGLRRGVAGAIVVLFAVRMGLLGIAWAAHRTDLADLRAVLEPVRPGQAVYVAEAGLREAPAYWAANPGWRLLSNGVRMDEHLGALVLIEHRAYWPFEFDEVSQQPMRTRSAYRRLAERVGSLPDRAAAAVANVCGFDYVLLLAADAVPRLPNDRFTLADRSGFAALYTIKACRETP